MKMSDTIRAALDKAERATCPTARTAHGSCATPCIYCPSIAANAIAAFLRALPIGLPTADKPSPFAFVSEEVKQQWVEAVLAAAKENQP
jgi:hypothetical protein